MYIYVVLAVIAFVMLVWQLWEADHGRQDEGEGEPWDSK